MEAKCYRAMRRAQCIVLKKFSQHVIAETLTRKKNAGHPAHLATHFSMGSLLFLIIVISQNGFCP